jgi:hypothetical protein
LIAGRLGVDAAQVRAVGVELRIRAAVADNDWSSVLGAGALSSMRYRWAKGGGALQWSKSLFHSDSLLFENSRSGRTGVVDWKTGSSAGVRTDGTATVKLGRDGLYAELSSEAEVGTEAHASGQVGGDDLNAAAAVSAFGGARASGGVGAGINTKGVSASAKGKLFAGIEGNAQTSATVSGVRGTAKAGVSAGLGATGEADLKVTASKIELKADLGLTLGIGGHTSFDVEVDPQHVINDVRHGASQAGKVLGDVGHGVEDGVKSTGRWFKHLL